MDTNAGFPQVLIGFVLGGIGCRLIGDNFSGKSSWLVLVIGLLLIAVGLFFVYAGCYSQDKANRR